MEPTEASDPASPPRGGMFGRPEDPASPPRGGVLAHLERLETQMSRSQKNLKEQAKEIEQQNRIRKLRFKQEQMRERLRKERQQLRQAAREAYLSRERASGACVEPGSPSAPSDQEALERKKTTVKALLQARHFTGISGKLTSRGVCVRLSTAFEGTLLESYFVDIVVQKPLWIHHHSIPPFIPLEELSAKYLQTNIRYFLFRLHEYLNAYSGRKYQADRLQSDFADFLAEPLQGNSLCNVLTFTYKVEPDSPSFPFCARLMYRDLTACLPTAVTVTHQGGAELLASEEEEEEEDAEAAVHEHLFRTQPLHHVFASFAKEGERKTHARSAS